MIRNPTPYPSPSGYAFGTLRERQSPTAGNPPAALDSPQARRGGNASELSQASREGNASDLSQASGGVNFPLCAGTEEGRGVRFYAVIEEETQ